MPNYSLNFDYTYNDTNSIFESYNPSLTYIIYKVFPKDQPYLIIDIGLKFDKNKTQVSINNERYYFTKVTYKPTNRFETILSYEKSIVKNSSQKDVGDDYEFILRFKTKVFN
ncbi:MAG: hypothetical protein LDL13_06370 [Calditerrivibrio sp.]|nr:hypothetical protein [Calditerrivibrio sp.]